MGLRCLGRGWWPMEWDYSGYVFVMVGAGWICGGWWWLIYIFAIFRSQHLPNTCKWFIIKYFTFENILCRNKRSVNVKISFFYSLNIHVYYITMCLNFIEELIILHLRNFI